MKTFSTIELAKKKNGLPVLGDESLDDRKNRVFAELKSLGATSYALRKSEARYLPILIHPDEHIKGVIYGHNDEGFVMIVATNLRVLYLDKKLLFVKTDELAYSIISGVSYSFAGFFASVKIHTRIGDYKLGLINNNCARNFVHFLETYCLQSQSTLPANELPS